jgi:hypothetical protein
MREPKGTIPGLTCGNNISALSPDWFSATTFAMLIIFSFCQGLFDYRNSATQTGVNPCPAPVLENRAVAGLQHSFVGYPTLIFE